MDFGCLSVTKICTSFVSEDRNQFDPEVLVSAVMSHLVANRPTCVPTTQVHPSTPVFEHYHGVSIQTEIASY